MAGDQLGKKAGAAVSQEQNRLAGKSELLN